MILGVEIDVLKRLASVAGVVTAIVVMLAVPRFRKMLIGCYRAGQRAGGHAGPKAGQEAERKDQARD